MDTVIRGNTITREAHYDLDGVLTDPALPRVTIRDSNGTAVIVDAVPTRIGTGIYQYDYPVALNALLGNWQDEWQGTISGQGIGPVIGFFEVLPVGAIVVVPSATYTYDLTTPVGQLRYLIQDTDMSSVSTSLQLEQRSAAFTDEELQFTLDFNSGGLLYSAAMQLRIWANNKQLIVISRRNGRAELDYGQIRRDLLAAAAEYERTADEQPADAIAEVNYGAFSERRIVWNNLLRTG